MAKESFSDRMSAPRPGIPTGRLILIIIAVLAGGFAIGALSGKLFPTKPGPATTRASTTSTTAATTAPVTLPR